MNQQLKGKMSLFLDILHVILCIGLLFLVFLWAYTGKIMAAVIILVTFVVIFMPVIDTIIRRIKNHKIKRG